LGWPHGSDSAVSLDDELVSGTMEPVDWTVVATLGVPATVAVGGLVATYVNNLRLARRRDRLDRVNSQLSGLYGPLLALVSTSTRAWEVFRSRYRTDVRSYWDQNEPPTPDEEEAWRLWIVEVFMPLNARMEELVITKADLLDSTAMPQCLLDLVAHVASFRAVTAAWAKGDRTINKAPLNFPRASVIEYAENVFAKLKAEQQELLGLLRP
jgi:hypothetical protein